MLRPGLLLLAARIVRALLVSLGVKAHIPGNGTAAPLTGLRVDDAGATTGRLDQFGVLLLEDLEVALGFPIPDAVGGKHQVHLLERALVGFGVEGPDDDDGGRVDGTEDIQGLFVEGGEHGREDEGGPAVADGPADHTPGVTTGPDFQGKDLGRVEPGHGEPGGTEDGGVEEHEEDGCATDTILVAW